MPFKDFILANNEFVMGLFGETYADSTYGGFKRLGFIFGKYF